MEIEKASWSDYNRFIDLCCVKTRPFPGGFCWIIKGDIGFIGYNYPYMNNRCRNRLFPEKLLLRRHIDLDWLNKNILQLNRVMVRPKYRCRGLATQLVKQTLPILGVPFVECITFSHLIEGVLKRCGFVNEGVTGGMKCKYYIWRRERP